MKTNKGLLRLAKIILPAILFTVLAGKVFEDRQTVIEVFRAQSWQRLIVVFLVMLTIYPEGAYSWHRILRALGERLPFSRSFAIWSIANTSRYIPGMIWQYLGRVEFAKSAGIARGKTISSLFMEILLVLAAGISVGLLATAPFLPELDIKLPLWLVLIPAPIALLHPSVVNRLIPRIAKVTGRDVGKVEKYLSLKEMLEIYPWFALNFVLNGVALWLLMQSLELGNSPGIVASIGFYSLSWVIGFVTIIAPGGLGVAEVSLALLLSSFLPFSVASAIAISYRVLLAISEFFVFIVALKIYYGKNG